MFDEAYSMNRKNLWFYHIWNFKKEHIILPYNLPKSNIPE